MKETIAYNINLNRILNILCSDIYDSPLSLLRENVQNAYDAILMRKAKENFAPIINVTIHEKTLVIEDNGVGMNMDTLKNNYWSAGSSGKNTKEAKDAGVIGTFGIGAMANFGVCDRIQVETRYIDDSITIMSSLNKKELSSIKDCIQISRDEHKRTESGTKIEVTLNNESIITIDDAVNYLSQYVKYIDVPIVVNGTNISGKDYHFNKDEKEQFCITNNQFDNKTWSFDYCIKAPKSKGDTLQAEITNVKYYGSVITGDMVLNTKYNVIYGLRNYFGLAAIPIESFFFSGGIANFFNLEPTAGRDALTQQSISFVGELVDIIDKIVAEIISTTDYADNSRAFIRYIYSKKLFNLASNITIQTTQKDERIKLNKISKRINDKDVKYYSGDDKEIIANYSDTSNIVLCPSKDFCRRTIQLNVLNSKGIEQIKDSPFVIHDSEVCDYDLMVSELSIKLRIKFIIEEDYLIQECEVKYVKISHNLNSMIEGNDNHICIYLDRDSADIGYLKEVYSKDYMLFEPFVKDFVRTKLYPKFSPYVPSSKRMGAEDLYKRLQRKRELYTIESSETGIIDQAIIKELLNGNMDLNDILREVKSNRRAQVQTLNPKSIGSVSEVLIGGVHSKETESLLKVENNNFDAMPPIMRLNVSTRFKVLQIDKSAPPLNGYKAFLSLSEQMFKENYDFFLQPHYTKVIWSMHKIIYIFTHASGKLTLYYDMNLEKKLDKDMTGGRFVQSCTIVTQDKIFIPIINEMDSYFDIKDGTRKFYVRYDTISQ